MSLTARCFAVHSGLLPREVSTVVRGLLCDSCVLGVRTGLSEQVPYGLYGASDHNQITRLACGARQDYEHIDSGHYSLPWDMVTPRNRQWSPLYVAQRSAQVRH